MRTIKIGKSSTNDVVVASNFVSSEHARITVYDSGQFMLKDLNSKNGTFLNGRKVLSEVPLKRGDEVRVANEVVDWEEGLRKVGAGNPKKTSISDVHGRHVRTIGRGEGCDLVFRGDDVSSSHATLTRNPDGSVELCDHHSTNGTYVNGVRVSQKRLVPGDVVLLCDKYPLEWEKVFPSVAGPKEGEERKEKALSGGRIGRRLLVVAAVAVVAVVVGVICFKASLFSFSWTPEKVYSTYKRSVVLVVHSFQFIVTAGDEVLAKYDEEVITGTGFFISSSGEIVTNRHVALPWKYDREQEKKLREAWQNRIMSLSAEHPYLQKYVNDVKVEGRTVALGVLLNDTYFNNESDVIPVTLVRESGNEEVDVALLQTNAKSLPSGVNKVVDVAGLHADALVKEGMPVYSIGFPAGFDLARTKTGISANCQDGKVTQSRGDVEFGHNINIVGGASGSPVFDDHGRLVGVIHKGYTGSQGYNMAVFARYVKELIK